jgi:hypothetical protein
VFVLIAYIFGMKSDKIWYLNYKSLPYIARDGYIEEKYPVDSVNFLIHNIKQNQLSGPMMNDHHFAGYLIWRMSPEYMKLFTDSRFDIWGSRLVKEETSVIYLASVPIGAYDSDDKWYDFPQHITRDNIKNMVEHNPGQFPDIENWLASGKEYWEYVLDKYEINFIFTYERKPIDRLLRSEYHGWFLIYDDVLQGKEGGYVIYIRNKPENMNIIRQYAYYHREHIPEE